MCYIRSLLPLTAKRGDGETRIGCEQWGQHQSQRTVAGIETREQIRRQTATDRAMNEIENNR